MASKVYKRRICQIDSSALLCILCRTFLIILYYYYTDCVTNKLGLNTAIKMKGSLFFLVAALWTLASANALPWEENPPNHALKQGHPFPGVHDFSVTSSSGRTYTINAYDNGNST